MMDRAQKAEKALLIIEAFVNAQEISCPEAIAQSDRVIENAYDFIEELCEVAGYWSDPEDDEAA